MKALLIEKTIVITSSAPGKQFQASVVCFEDSFYIILKQFATTFRVDADPVPSYDFGDKSVEEGLNDLMSSCSDEAELKGKLLELVQGNTTLIVNFSDFKKVKVKGLLGTKTLKASNSAMSYVSFNAGKSEGKKLVEFYPNL